jgi:hypothetical protein
MEYGTYFKQGYFMTEQELCNILRELIDLDEELENTSTIDFRNAGVMTNEKGFIFKIDGEEFQVTIVKSKG